MCVCHPWSHRDAFAFILLQGGSGPFSSHCLTKTLLIGCDMTLGRQSHVPAIFHFPYGKRPSQEPRYSDVLLFFFALQMRAERRQPVRPSFVFFFFGPFLRLKTSRIRWFPTDTLRKWNPRPACGTAFSSVHHILSVFGLVPTRDEPAECLPWTRRTGVRRCISLALET